MPPRPVFPMTEESPYVQELKRAWEEERVGLMDAAAKAGTPAAVLGSTNNNPIYAKYMVII